ncbi:hypothetical protein GC169_07555 [bacterium]|nr:hypothetical protein [bacterium]
MKATEMVRLNVTLFVAAATVAAAGCDHVAGHPHQALHAQQRDEAVSANLQGDQMQVWMENPHIRKFYEATREAFANGPDAVDAEAYRIRSTAIFRDMAVGMKLDPNAMQDHLKAIPDQMIAIANEDPSVLASFDAFRTALFGPL